MSTKEPVDPIISKKMAEFGRKGGLSTLAKHGREHYVHIATKPRIRKKILKSTIKVDMLKYREYEEKHNQFVEEEKK